MVIAETAAPAWIPVVAFAIPISIMLGVGIPALRRRGRAAAARAAQASRRSDRDTELGTAADVEDPSTYSTVALLKALAVRPEDHGPTPDGMPHDEGWAGTMLGLKSKMSSATTLLEPHVFWGTHAGAQVFVRMGPDEKIEGGTTMMSNRHVRQITVLRVESPRLVVRSEGGALRASADSPPDVQGIVAALRPDVPTWSDTRIYGGPKGIVATRDAIDGLEHSWVYDLWLLERIARVLRLDPLKPARIGPAWKTPYGLGRSLEPEDF